MTPLTREGSVPTPEVPEGHDFQPDNRLMILYGLYRDELTRNLEAAREAIFRCTVERDSSLAEYAHLFAQRLEQQVISVIEDGLEALSICEEAGDDLDENTKKRLLNYVHEALKFKGLEESS